MLDNERLIAKMVLEQKLRLITSADFYKSSPVGNYEFPVVEFGEKPLRGKEGVSTTQFPSDRTLAASWNTALTEKVFACIGEEARAHSVYEGYLSANNPVNSDISSSHFLNAQYLAAKHRGVANKQPTAHRCVPAAMQEGQLRRNAADILLEDGAPDVLIAECVEDAQYYLKNQNFNGLVYGVASNPEEVARYFFEGCSFVYLREDFLQDLIAFIDVRTKNYRVAYGEYKENRLSLKELDRRARAQEIFDENLIDTACDRIINYLKKRKKAEAETSKDAAVVSERINLARKAARESIVLLKNTSNFLPLQQRAKVALIGEYAENFDFQRETFACSPTKERLPIEVAKEYDELDIVGYAAGYRKDKGIDEGLLSNAAKLSAGADCAVVFLSANPGEDVLPENQLMLVKALLGWRIKVVAVISADRCIDMSFAKDCQAILYTGRGGQEVSGAVFDLLTGTYSPSGKLTEKSGGVGGYPFGYGLTYTAFAYSDLEIDEGGVSVIVENKGKVDAYAIVQLYLQKEGSMFAEKTLRGFAKEFIKKGDAVRVRIPFTENTFRYYDEQKKKYRTQGGVYSLFVSECVTADKLTGTVSLAADDGRVFTNTILETAADGKKIAFSETRGLKERKGMSFGWKLFIVLSLLVYYNAMAVMLLFAPFVPITRTGFFYLLIGVLTAVVNIVLLVVLIVICVKRRKQYHSTNEVLGDMIDKVDEFIEIAKLTYPDPIKERAKAEKAQKLEEERKAREEALARAKEKAEAEKKEQAKAEEKKPTDTKKAKRAPSIDKPSDYPEAHSFEEVYLSFRNYLMERGINIGAASARRLIAAGASARLVLITSKNGELLPDFLQAVNGYFGGSGVTEAQDNWNTTEDLLWSEVSGRRTVSPFLSAINDTLKRHNKNAVALISNVDSANLPDWFAEMIEFASSPSEDHYIYINDARKLIPQNLCCLLFSKETGFETEFQRDALNASLQIDISIRRAESVAENPQAVGSISYPNMQALVREAREKYFISERNWAKMDSIFEFLRSHGKLSFGNKNTIMAEKFTSALMACGAEESEALTSLLRFKIVPLLKTTQEYHQENGVNLIFDFIQKSFPDEDLSKVQKLLSERPKKVEQKTSSAFFTPDRAQAEQAESSAAEQGNSTAYEEAPAAEADQTPAYEQAPAYDDAAPWYEEAQPAYGAAEPAYEQPSYDAGSAYGNDGTDHSGYYDQNAGYQYDGQNYSDGYQNGEYQNYSDGYQNAGYDQNAYDQNAYGDYQNGYQNGGYENYSDGYQNGGYQNYSDGYQNAGYDQNAYDQNAYGDYQNGYGYQSNEGNEYGNYSADNWSDSDNGAGGNK